MIVPSIDYSIRTHNAPSKSQQLYTELDVWNKIIDNSVASKAYKRISEQGYQIILNYNHDTSAGRTIHPKAIVEIFVLHNTNVDRAVGTIVHESTHVEYRNQKRNSSNTQYEEYRAFVREELYNNSKNPHIQTRPTMEERLEFWETVKHSYPELPQGKNPFGDSI